MLKIARKDAETQSQMLKELELKQVNEEPMGLVATLTSFLFGCLSMGLPFAAIIAAIVKKKAPELGMRN